MLTWAHQRGIALRLIEPGKPNQNACIESFNGRFPDERFNELIRRNDTGTRDRRSVARRIL